MLLRGAFNILKNDPKPLWMMEISSKEHQPKGTIFNPNFAKTFELFFQNGYSSCTANSQEIKISQHEVDQVISGELDLNYYNFLFR
jgi:hypothetical protein